MADYNTVKALIEDGTPDDVICSMCPWTRPCVSPPEMSKAEVDQSIAKAQAESDAKKAAGDGDGFAGMLVTTLFMAGKDTQATCCPVFIRRLKSPQGRTLGDGFRSAMQGWTAGSDEDAS